MGRPPLGRARGGGLVAQGRGGRCVVSLDAFLSRGCEKARFGALARESNSEPRGMNEHCPTRPPVAGKNRARREVLTPILTQLALTDTTVTILAKVASMGLPSSHRG